MNEFFLRERTLLSFESDEQNNVVGLGYQLKCDYDLAKFRAVIIALGGKILEVKFRDHYNVTNRKTGTTVAPHDSLYTRDPLVILPDRKLIIYAKSSMAPEALSIIEAFPQSRNYRILGVDNVHFEGGNIIYLQDKSILLHGPDPRGYYQDLDVVPTEHINTRLAECLSIRVEGLQLNTTIRKKPYQYEYYHLDCFMQRLPDGRVVILNKEILSPASHVMLESILGTNFIDLAYPDYLIDPIILNFLSVQTPTGTAIVSSNLPVFVSNKLMALGLQVITPNTLDSRTPYFNAELATRAAKALKEDGFATAEANNLYTHLPKNRNGYLLDNGGHLSSNIWDMISASYGLANMDEYYSSITKGNPSFHFGVGGPHCLTLEVEYVTPKKPQMQLSRFRGRLFPINHNRVRTINDSPADDSRYLPISNIL